MKLFTTSMVIGLCLALSVTANGQAPFTNQDSLSRVKADSIQRILLKDSLSLSDQIVDQVLAIRDSSIARTERIKMNSSLTTGQQNIAMLTLRRETTDAMKTIMGVTAYNTYLELIVGRKPD